MAPAVEMCSTWRMSTATLRDENERLKALLAQTQAALSEHQAALATSEEARRRLEVILGELRREKFGAKSEKLRPDQYHLPLEDAEIAQGVLERFPITLRRNQPRRDNFDIPRVRSV
ncbi:transposase (plasmid) [Bradyrhizobium barranii subsp. apii]|uniref:Transposase n=1 Tax=Bradyrhizobium barranii subsp. apii TaxID=2819348 RepID=A0A8T5VT00_9BRAD|nr:transposase [Bradyrhizobium barranii]UPT92145.1 transposase [Bradyrhizobium barranii subsp. apii]